MLRPLFLALLLCAAEARAETYPLQIEHAFGVTTLTKKPERIATVNWSNHEVPLALGVVPVGFAAANFGDDDGDGVLPWVEARLAELGAPVPMLFDEGDGIDFEAVAASQPDVILAAYSGLSVQDYQTLSKIAPVVAYPEAPWATDWRDTILLNSRGMGMAAEGAALVADLETRIKAVRAKYPQFAGKTAMFVTHLSARDLSQIGFYTARDSRGRFLQDLGFAAPDLVEQAGALGAFSGQVSAERIDELASVDLFITYGKADLAAALREDILLRHLPALSKGGLVMLDNDPQGTAANPTPMSLPWVLEGYAARLAQALDGASGTGAP